MKRATIYNLSPGDIVYGVLPPSRPDSAYMTHGPLRFIGKVVGHQIPGSLGHGPFTALIYRFDGVPGAGDIIDGYPTWQVFNNGTFYAADCSYGKLYIIETADELHKIRDYVNQIAIVHEL